MTLAKIRQAVADYIRSEGCCGDYDQHNVDAAALGKILRVKPYKDGSGYHFSLYQTKREGDV